MSEIYVILTITITLIMCVSVFLIDILSRNRQSKYNDEKNRIELDRTRAYYEERLYRIQDELMKNERRWADVNNLVVSAQTNKTLNSTKDNVVELIQKNFGIENIDCSENKRSVFVLTPFLEREFETFEAIKNTCMEVNLTCTRGDEVFRDKDILTHIITSISKSSVIIANLNGRNANVFYELGICHSMGKPIILISRNKNNLPFDIQNKNIVFYNSLYDLQHQLKDELLKIFIDKNHLE